MKNQSSNKYSCLLCQKCFETDLQRKIHEKFKHKKPTLQNSQNINSSDISDEQEEDIKRYRQIYKKQTENSANQNSKALQCDETQGQRGHEKQVKNILPGKFDDPTLQKNSFKKIYLCGCSQKVFQNSQSLTLHISKQHNGFPPQGTLYGVWRDLVMKQFQPVQQKVLAIRPFIEKTQFVCGCSLSYARLSSLKHHIRTNHQGVIPLGTIGLPKSTQKELSDQRSSADNKQSALCCTACFETLTTSYWICDSCHQWRICGSCIDSDQKLKQHQNLNHKIHQIQFN